MGRKSMASDVTKPTNAEPDGLSGNEAVAWALRQDESIATAFRAAWRDFGKAIDVAEEEQKR
jgi:hypothetical protein